MPESRQSTECKYREHRFSAGALRIVLMLTLVALWPARSLTDNESASTFKPASAQQAAIARPEIMLDATRRDYGEVFAGEILDTPFNIVNAGKAPLELMQRSLTSSMSSSLRYGKFDTSLDGHNLVPVAGRLAAPS